MQTPKGRITSSEVPRKVSPRAVRQSKTTGLSSSETGSSSNVARKTAKEGSPKAIERQSPKTPVTEKKRSPSRILELESQVSQLREELKKLRDQLVESDTSKKEAQDEAESSKKQLLDASLKLEETQKQLLELSASTETRVSDLEKLSASDEIHRLKFQLEMVAESEAAQKKHAELADMELETLRENLNDSLSLVENMKSQLRDSKASEARARELASETLMQLNAAKNCIEALKLDGTKTIEAYNSITSELAQSHARVNLLEKLVGELNGKSAEGYMLKSEVSLLRSALEVSEIRRHEEEIRSVVEIRSTYEMVEEMKSGSIQGDSELEAELKRAKADIEQLKADLMDKETELQWISEENEDLNMKIKNNNFSSQREFELENEVKKLKESIADLKNSLLDKENELQNIAEENEDLKEKIKIREISTSQANEVMVSELEAMKSRETEAISRLEFAMEERDRSSKKVERATEQLEAAQVANAELEAELRRIKVQSDQWRKAAEAAVAMISELNCNANGKFVERTGSLNGVYDSVLRSPYNNEVDEEEEDEVMKKKNGNVLKKIGVLWKKQQK